MKLNALGQHCRAMVEPLQWILSCLTSSHSAPEASSNNVLADRPTAAYPGEVADGDDIGRSFEKVVIGCRGDGPDCRPLRGRRRSIAES
jgi:hypothetical protein